MAAVPQKELHDATAGRHQRRAGTINLNTDVKPLPSASTQHSNTLVVSVRLSAIELLLQLDESMDAFLTGLVAADQGQLVVAHTPKAEHVAGGTPWLPAFLWVLSNEAIHLLIELLDLPNVSRLAALRRQLIRSSSSPLLLCTLTPICGAGISHVGQVTVETAACTCAPVHSTAQTDTCSLSEFGLHGVYLGMKSWTGGWSSLLGGIAAKPFDTCAPVFCLFALCPCNVPDENRLLFGG